MQHTVRVEGIGLDVTVARSSDGRPMVRVGCETRDAGWIGWMPAGAGELRRLADVLDRLERVERSDAIIAGELEGNAALRRRLEGFADRGDWMAARELEELGDRPAPASFADRAACVAAKNAGEHYSPSCPNCSPKQRPARG